MQTPYTKETKETKKTVPHPNRPDGLSRVGQADAAVLPARLKARVQAGKPRMQTATSSVWSTSCQS